MSSRVLRKLGLQGEKETTSLADEASDTEADFSSSGGAKKKQLNINRYDLVSAKYLEPTFMYMKGLKVYA